MEVTEIVGVTDDDEEGRNDAVLVALNDFVEVGVIDGVFDDVGEARIITGSSIIGNKLAFILLK